MRKKIFLALLTPFLFIHFSLAYDVNKDLKNLGPAAYDIAVVLAGTESVVAHYDGYPWANFGGFSNGPIGPNHLLHWQYFWDGTDNRIDNGQIIHVGWSTADHSSTVVDMYWTDQCGRRIPGSIVYNITSNWTYESSRRECTATWTNHFDNEPLVEISNIQFAVRPERYNLADLNGANEELVRSLQPLTDRRVTLCHGQTFSASIPDSFAQNVVLVYDVNSRGSAAASRDFVQFQCLPSDSGGGFGIASTN